jgi:6-phosphogluconate dehydrogenase
MQLGMIGLGRMGASMVQRLMRAGHACVVHDHESKALKAMADEGAAGRADLDSFVAALEKPRVVWLMVPSAEALLARDGRAWRPCRACREKDNGS